MLEGPSPTRFVAVTVNEQVSPLYIGTTWEVVGAVIEKVVSAVAVATPESPEQLVWLSV